MGPLHFNARTRADKLALRKQDADLRAQLAVALESGGYGHDEAQRVAAWDPYSQSTAADWFDTQWMFGVTDGFDVVIGNPPYVRADFDDDQHRRTRSILRNDGEYETLWEKWDLFVPFMERSFKLLREGGVTSLIVSDAFCHAKYALKAREWFLRNARVLRLDFYGNLKLFDAAVHNISYVFQRGKLAGNEPMRRLHQSEFGDVELLTTAAQANLTERAFVPIELYEPPPARTVPLGDICYVSYGLRANADDRFWKGAFRTEDITSDSADEKHPMAFVQGKHVDRWSTPSHIYLEWNTSRAPSQFVRKTFDALYEQSEKIIAQRTPGPDPKSCIDSAARRFDASCVGFVRWNGLTGIRNRSISKQARYPGEKLRSKLPHREKLEAISKRFHLKYVLGVMNSHPALEFLSAHRRSNLHLYPDDWKKLPIPDVPKSRQQAVARLVDKILKAKARSADANVAELEHQIDAAVREDYGYEP